MLHGYKQLYILQKTFTEDIYVYIAKDVETRFYTSNYELDGLLPKGENKKLVGLMKENLVRKIVTKFFASRPKAYSYLTDDNEENKKTKGTKIA